MAQNIAIAGAGISGLTTAYALQKKGHNVTVFEATDQPGGPIYTVDRDGYRVETGPHTLLIRHRVAAELLEELGLGDRSIDAGETAKKRFVVRNGQPVALPMSAIDFATTPLLSPAARLRLLAEPLMPKFEAQDIDETLASFIRRRLGPEALNYLIDPFVGGVFAGNPAQLSARHAFPTLVEFEQSAGSIVLGAIKQRFLGGPEKDRVPRRLISFDKGMKTLIDALIDRLDDSLRLNAPVRKLRLDDDGWRVIYQKGKARRGETFDAVVSTIPPWALSELQWENARPPSGAIDELSTMPYAPCSVVTLGFEETQIGHPLDGFGVLVPKVEHFHILGALFVSSMFPNRAPEGCVNLTAFVGGARSPELAGEDEETLIELARHDLGRLLDITGEPNFTNITRWDKAIPQYEVGHQVFLNHIADIEEHLPRLYFAGNYRDGIGVPDLLGAAVEHAERIDESLSI